MNKKNSIKRQFSRNMKYKSRKNNKMIGGNCITTHKSKSECDDDIKCFWNAKYNICLGKIDAPKKTLAPSLKTAPVRSTFVSKSALTAKLDKLELVSPLLSSDSNWPLITNVVNVLGDDDCLFHALRAGLISVGLYKGNARELRALIVTELRKLLKNGDDLSVVFSLADEQGRRADDLLFGTYFDTQYASDPITDANAAVIAQQKKIANLTAACELAETLLESETSLVAPPTIKGKTQQPSLNPLINDLILKRGNLERAKTDLIKYKTAVKTAVKVPLNLQVKRYLDGMAERKWGTEIEIWMASRIFNVNIDVYTLPRDPLTQEVLPNGKSADGQPIPLTILNKDINRELPTIRLFNASGATPTGIHYQFIPASKSLNEFLRDQQQP